MSYKLYRFHGQGIGLSHPIKASYATKEDFDKAVAYNQKYRGTHTLISKERVENHGLLDDQTIEKLFYQVRDGEFDDANEVTRITCCSRLAFI